MRSFCSSFSRLGFTLALSALWVGMLLFVISPQDGARIYAASPPVVAASATDCSATANDGVTVFTTVDAAALQSAIDAAADGDTVKVAGTCTGVQLVDGTNQTGYISKSLTLRGGYSSVDWTTSDPDANPTPLDAAQGGRVLRITGGITVTVENLRLTGGTGDGAGVSNSVATVVISNSLIYSNASSNFGGGLLNADGGQVTVNASTFISNTAVSGGGLYNATGGQVTVNASVFMSNTVTDTGGGLVNDNGVITVTNGSLVQNNGAATGGGIWNSTNSRLILNQSDVISNSATNSGGGIYNASSSHVTIDAGSVVTNTANSGAGLYNTSNGSVITVTNGSRVEGNVAQLFGGALYNFGGGQVTINASDVVSNSGRLIAGGLYNDGTNTALTVTNGSLIAQNTTTGSGGGIWNNDGRVNVDGSTVTENRAPSGDGGGIYNQSNVGSGRIVLNAATVTSNTARFNGGGIGSFSPNSLVTVTNSSLLGNNAINGDAFYQQDGSSSITASCIVQNSDTAVTYAGGTAPIDATGNWWGHRTGPSGAGTGLGDSVGSNVDFAGFVTNAILGCPTFDDPDVDIVKAATISDALPGQPVTYTLSFSNTGGRIARAVVISDSVPFSLTEISAQTALSVGVTITPTGAAPNLAWQVSNLSVGAGGVITVTAKVTNLLSAGDVITNTAIITAAEDTTSGNNASSAAITLTVPTVSFSTAAFNVGEADGSATVTLTLDAPNPYAPVTVLLTSSDDTATSAADYVAVSQTVTFNAGEVQITASVPITDDAEDENDETFGLTLSDPVGAALGATIAAGVTIVDNDTAGVNVSPGAVDASEAGATENYNIVLDSQPTGAVTITVNADSQTTATPTQLIFTPGNWSTAQTVTAGAVQDNIAEGQHSGVISHTVESGDTNYNGITVDSVAVTITDDDSPCVCVTVGTVTVGEDGQTGSYALFLTTQPSDVVTVTLVLTDGQIGVSPTQLVFTPLTWSSLQTVTVTAANDAIAEGTLTRIIAHSVTSSDADYDVLDDRTVTVNIVDDDNAGVTVTPTAVDASEAGATQEYSVTLNSQPTGPVTITVSADSQATATPTQLIFTPGNWSTPQTVTAGAVQDNIAEGEHSGVISHTVESGDTNYNGITVDSVAVTITDDDSPCVCVTVGTVTVGEDGQTGSYALFLTTQPSDVVTVTLVLTDGQIGVSPTQLVFTPLTWSSLQTVTVTAANDAIAEGDMQRIIAHSVDSNDANYDVIDDRTVTVNIGDDDTAGVSVNPTSGLITTEAGGTATFTVALGSEPTSTVTVTLTSNDTSEGTVSPTEVVFTAGDWATPQIVTLTGVDDTVVDGNIAYTVESSVSSGDATYNAIATADVSVTNTDDETILAVEKSANTVNVDEGSIVTYTVVVRNMGGNPAGNVTVRDDMTGTLAGGVTLAAGEIVTYTYSLKTDDGPRTVVNTVTVTSTQAAMITAGVGITVNNVAPTAVLSNTGPVDDGSEATVSFSAQDDASSVDVTAGFRYSFDFDNDGTFEVTDVISPSATVAASYLTGVSSRTVRGRIADKDGGFNDYTTVIQVNAQTEFVVYLSMIAKTESVNANDFAD